MSYRLLTPFFLCIVVAPLGAQGFRYTPGTGTYEATVVTRMTREIGGQRMSDEVTQRQRLTVTVSDRGADTLALGVRLDTAAVTSGAGPQDVKALLGLQVQGLVSPLGQVYASRLTNSDIGPAGAVIADELAKFLPRMRSDLRPGLAWTDTTTEEVAMLGIPIRRRTVTTSKVVGDTVVGGRAAWRIDRSAAVSFTGDGTVQGQPLKLVGSSQADGRIFVTRAGRYLGSTQTDSVKTNFTSGAMAFTLVQAQTTDVRLAP